MTCLIMNRKAQVACNFNGLIKTEGLPKATQADAYIANVAISRKLCKADTWLLQTTYQKRYFAYQTAAIQTTLSVVLCGSGFSSIGSVSD